jgi:leader peptidase (prepilin peptidase) / N-methyltransferase
VDAIADFLASPAALGFAAAWGAVWGSFFNVVIARLPRGESVVRPASRCMACGAPVRAWDNVPVLSYLWLRGRCRACGVRFSARYPLVELGTALLSAAIFWKFAGAKADSAEIVAVRLGRFAIYFAWAGALVVLALIDLDTRRLPDVITIPGTILFFAGAFAAHDVPWTDRAIGVAVGYLFVRLVADFYYYVLRREGLGLGDGKLLAMVGAVMGWRSIPIVLFLGSLAGSAIMIPVLLVTRRRSVQSAAQGTGEQQQPPPPFEPGADREAEVEPASLRRTQIPFGPFLVVAALIYLFAGDQIWTLLIPPG